MPLGTLETVVFLWDRHTDKATVEGWIIIFSFLIRVYMATKKPHFTYEGAPALGEFSLYRCFLHTDFHGLFSFTTYEGGFGF